MRDRLGTRELIRRSGAPAQWPHRRTGSAAGRAPKPGAIRAAIRPQPGCQSSEAAQTPGGLAGTRMRTIVPPPGAALALTRPGVQLRDLADDREAEAAPGERPRAGAAEEAVEDVRQLIGGDAGAVVADLELAVVQAHLDRRVGAGELDGVVEQVVDGAVKARRHAVDERRLELDLEAHGGRVAARPLDRLGDEHVQAHVLALIEALGLARELDQVVDERGELLELVDEIRGEARAVAGRQLVGSLEQLDVRAQARHRRAQLVRGVGDQPSLHARGLVELVHGLLEDREQRVEARREAAELVASILVDALAQIEGLARHGARSRSGGAPARASCARRTSRAAWRARSPRA